MKTATQKEKRARRHGRIRSKIKGTADRPRLSVFRSNRYVWAQLIDDETGRTLVAAGTRDLGTAAKTKAKPKQAVRPKGYPDGRTAAAAAIGEKIAGEAREKKIAAVVFDRGGYRYHGVVKAVAEGARKGGLKL
ncbi:MAG: 50S ribosomal protein L18 [Candidatus Sungbacteria bacterium]|nr:50S ribosomal protein L18 [Candidatus Sungbacteria bacterium]